MKKSLWIWFVFWPILAIAQEAGLDTLDGFVLNGDTLYIKELSEITVAPRPRTEFKNKREWRHYGRLLHDVKKTLPYAKLAGDLLTEVNDTLHTLETKKEQKKYLKDVEEELFAQYEPVLRKMSRRQGGVLIKLIDRECQISSYEVVKIYRGNFSAFFWQGIARIFGSDLRSIYDPKGEDALMEEVVLLVEAGVV